MTATESMYWLTTPEFLVQGFPCSRWCVRIGGTLVRITRGVEGMIVSYYLETTAGVTATSEVHRSVTTHNESHVKTNGCSLRVCETPMLVLHPSHRP